MDKKYTMTYKVAPMGAKYIYQADKEKHKAGDIDSSVGGHMWYVLSDGQGEELSYGFESSLGEPFGEGKVTNYDNAAYQQTSYEATLALTEAQYNKLKDFSKTPASGGFDDSKYSVHTNSCVDFVYYSLNVIGYNGQHFEGNLLPNHNPASLKSMLITKGAFIIRDDLIRNGDKYEKRIPNITMNTPPWLMPISGNGPLPSPPKSIIKININPAPKPQQQIQAENQAQLDVSNGYIHNSPTHKISANDDILRPGAVQLDTNIRPNAYLAEFYKPSHFSSGKPYFRPGDTCQLDVGLKNAAMLKGLSARTTFNTYVDPLLLDLSGQGVHMTDMRDGLLFDMDHSGTLKRTGWADRQTGILVIDDGSGQIKNVSQMFSEYYGGRVGSNGVAGEKIFADGFAALGSEDSNQDGVIDKRDPIWGQLRVWLDASHDAKVDAGELKTLTELGITQSNVRSANKNEVRNGNRVVASGSFMMQGQTWEILAVNFVADPVSNTLTTQGTGTRVTSTFNGITTMAYASHSDSEQTPDADKLGVSNLYGGSGDDQLIAAKTGRWVVQAAIPMLLVPVTMFLLSALLTIAKIFMVTADRIWPLSPVTKV